MDTTHPLQGGFSGKHAHLCGPRSMTSGILHYIGMVLAVLGTVLLLVQAVQTGADHWKIISLCVYGISMISLYAASGTYHIFYVSDRVHRVLRKLDHCMIFFLIAGSYTPLCLVALRGVAGWVLFGCVWGFSLFGMVLKMFWIDAPRWVSSLVYVLVGWMALFAIVPLAKVMPGKGLFWLFAGGALYSVGAVIYALKKLEIPNRYFGNHELFHLFVLAGSLCHFIMMYLYI